MTFCNWCLNILRRRMLGESTLFECEECKYQKEIPGTYRTRMSLEPKKEETHVQKTELPEREVTCPRCLFGRANYYQMQTRSADEPMTIFNACTKCKHSWRE